MAAPRLVTPQNVTPWLSWFLACQLGAVQGADGLLAVLLDKAQFWQRWAGMPMNARQTLVLNHMLDRAPDAMEVKHDKCQVGRSGQMLAGHGAEGYQRLVSAWGVAQAGGRRTEDGVCVGQIGRMATYRNRPRAALQLVDSTGCFRLILCNRHDESKT